MKKLIQFFVLVAMFIVSPMLLSAQNFYVEADGIGPIRVGKDYRTLPKSVEGLYDKLTVVEEYNSMEDYNEIYCTFSLKGADRFYAFANEEGDIWSVSMATPDLRTKSGAYNGMPARDFIKLTGVKAVLRPEADYNPVLFEIDGVTVVIDEYSFSTAGNQKVQKAVRTKATPTFVATDFTPEAVISLGAPNW